LQQFLTDQKPSGCPTDIDEALNEKTQLILTLNLTFPAVFVCTFQAVSSFPQIISGMYLVFMLLISQLDALRALNDATVIFIQLIIHWCSNNKTTVRVNSPWGHDIF